MSLLKSNSVQIGQSATATQNFTLSVPSSPDGTIKLARGNSGATTADVLTVDASGNVTTTLANGSISASKLSGAQSGSAPIFGARAWVNFDGTRNEGDTGASTDGASVKIRASGNVTSVLKNVAGDYTVNFTTAMVDTNYVVNACSSQNSSSQYCFTNTSTQSTSSVRVQNVNVTPSLADNSNMLVAVFR